MPEEVGIPKSPDSTLDFNKGNYTPASSYIATQWTRGVTPINQLMLSFLFLDDSFIHLCEFKNHVSFSCKLQPICLTETIGEQDDLKNVIVFLLSK